MNLQCKVTGYGGSYGNRRVHSLLDCLAVAVSAPETTWASNHIPLIYYKMTTNPCANEALYADSIPLYIYLLVTYKLIW